MFTSATRSRLSRVGVGEVADRCVGGVVDEQTDLVAVHRRGEQGMARPRADDAPDPDTGTGAQFCRELPQGSRAPRREQEVEAATREGACIRGAEAFRRPCDERPGAIPLSKPFRVRHTAPPPPGRGGYYRLPMLSIPEA